MVAICPNGLRTAHHELTIDLTEDTLTIANINTTIGYARYSGTEQLIEYIFVHPAFRRMGYGKRMVEILANHVGQSLHPEPPISPLGHRLFGVVKPK